MRSREIRLKELFEALIELPTEELEREAFVRDPELAVEALRLVRLDQAANRRELQVTPVSVPVLLPGALVADLRLVEPLSAGGSADVWLAQPVRGQAPVVVKFARTAGSSDPAVVGSFQRERVALETLWRPEVPRLLGAGELQAGQPFLVLEACAGSPLDEQRWSACSKPGLDLALALADALGALHADGFAHGDIKPAHLLLDDAGCVRWIDFGSARNLQEDAGQGFEPVTPAWSAPERLAGEPPDGRSDVFSLARVIRGAWSSKRRRSELGFEAAHAVEAVLLEAESASRLARPADGHAFGHRLREAVYACEQRAQARRTRFGVLAMGALLAAGLVGWSLVLNGQRRSSERILEAAASALSATPDGASVAVLRTSGSPGAERLLLAEAERAIDAGDPDRARSLLGDAPDGWADPRSSAEAAGHWLRLGRPDLADTELSTVRASTPELEAARGLVQLEWGLYHSARTLLNRALEAPSLSADWKTRVLGARLVCLAATASEESFEAAKLEYRDLSPGTWPWIARGEAHLRARIGRYPKDGRLEELLEGVGTARSYDGVRDQARWTAALDPVRARRQLDDLGWMDPELELEIGFAELARGVDYEQAVALRRRLARVLGEAELTFPQDCGRVLGWRVQLARSAFQGADPNGTGYAETLAERLSQSAEPSVWDGPGWRTVAWVRAEPSRDAAALEALDFLPAETPLEAAHRAALRLLCDRDADRHALAQSLEGSLRAMCPVDEPLSEVIAGWLPEMLLACSGDPHALRCAASCLATLADPREDRAMRAVHVVFALPQTPMAGAPDPSSIYDCAVAETDQAVRVRWDEGEGFGAWLARELLARGAYRHLGRLAETYRGRPSQTARLLFDLLVALEPLAQFEAIRADAPPAPQATWRTVLKRLSKIEPADLDPDTRPLFEQIGARAGRDHGPAFEADFLEQLGVGSAPKIRPEHADTPG